jgi:hypothetical protein
MKDKIATIIADVHVAQAAGRLDLAIARALVGLHALSSELDAADDTLRALAVDVAPSKPIAFGLETSAPMKGKGK